jgi:O-antigen ligase
VAPAPPIVKPAPTNPTPDPDENHVFRKIVVGFSLAALFVRFGVLPELIAVLTGVNTYLLYFTAGPAILATILSGGWRRTFRLRASYWWMAFFLWMVIATPFSFWQGGSARLLLAYVRTDLVFLFIAGGLAVRWGEVRALFYTIGAAAVVNLLTSQILMKTAQGRVSLVGIGTIGNSNDLAAHLVLVLPFLAFITMDPKRSFFIKFPVLLGIAYGIWVIVGTASRGALVALLAALVFILWRATTAQRVVTLAVPAFIGVLTVAALPSMTLNRLGNLFGEEHEEATESGEVRSYLFKQSLLFTVQRPLFGVGPGQFSNYEGNTRVEAGQIGVWKDPHFIFTQISADCGIPGLIFYVGGLISAIWVVVRTRRKARQQKNLEIMNACFCYLLGMVAFLVAGSLLPFAYHFYYPTMIGIAVSLSIAANRQLDTAAAAIQPRMSALG